MRAPERAVFLDRDGVLVEEVSLLREPGRIRVLEGVVDALAALRDAGYRLVVVTNQTVVSRGLATEGEVEALNREVASRIELLGGPLLDAFYVCPHHPAATLEAYRLECECRKPRPGLLLRAASELGLDLERSFMVGDRITDVLAGVAAGCRTVLVRSGAHLGPPIETPEPLDLSMRADHECDDLRQAARWILAAA